MPRTPKPDANAIRARNRARRKEARRLVEVVRRELPDDAPGEALRAEAARRLLAWLVGQARAPWLRAVLVWIVSAVDDPLIALAEGLVQEAYDDMRTGREAA